MSLRTRLQDHEPEQHDRWLISYADFITLLFAFFVVMYAVSSVNDGKYRVLSDSLETAFRDPQSRLLPIDLGGGMTYGTGGDRQRAGGTAIALGESISELEEAGLEREPNARLAGVSANDEVIEVANAEAAGELLNRRLSAAIDPEQFDVRQGEDWLQIELQSEFMFDSGSARLQPDSGGVLAAIIPVLAALPGAIRVEGYTDKQPISSARFPSNWELSAARAGSIVRYFESGGIAANRLAAVGFGEHHPVADDNNADGRRRNRRVVISVAAEPGSELEREAAGRQAAAGANGAVAEKKDAVQSSPAAAADRGIYLQRVTNLPPPFTIQ